MDRATIAWQDCHSIDPPDRADADAAPGWRAPAAAAERPLDVAAAPDEAGPYPDIAVPL